MGANLEVFKFATYLFIPLFAMLHFGDPDWYEHHVQPYKEKLWPVPYEETNKPPKTQPELHAELERLRAERLARARAAPPPTAPAPAAQPSAVLAGLDERRGEVPDWAAGDKRLV